MTTLDRLRPRSAAAACGMAAAAWNEALARAARGGQFGQPIGDLPDRAREVGRMATELQASRLLVYYAAWLKDRGADRITSKAAMAKSYATEARAAESLTRPPESMGGALSGRQSVERLYGRSARCASTKAPRRCSGSSSAGALRRRQPRVTRRIFRARAVQRDAALDSVCVGGGPGSLYFALRVKKSDPGHASGVVEGTVPTTRSASACGFSDATMAELPTPIRMPTVASPTSRSLGRHRRALRRPGAPLDRTRLRGMSRHTLLRVLREQAGAVGVELDSNRRWSRSRRLPGPTS